MPSPPPPNPDSPLVLFSGSCACLRINYTCTSLPTSSPVCHCITCRKLSGAAWQAFTDVPSRSLVYTDNSTTPPVTQVGLPPSPSGGTNETAEMGITLLCLSEIAERAFCASCHSALAMRYRHDPGTVSVTLGTVDEGTVADAEVRAALRPTVHIFVGQRAWWGRDPREEEGEAVRVQERFSREFEEELARWRGERERERDGDGGVVVG